MAELAFVVILAVVALPAAGWARSTREDGVALPELLQLIAALTAVLWTFAALSASSAGTWPIDLPVGVRVAGCLAVGAAVLPALMRLEDQRSRALLGAGAAATVLGLASGSWVPVALGAVATLCAIISRPRTVAAQEGAPASDLP